MSKLKTTFLIFIGLITILLVSNWAATIYLKGQIKKSQPQTNENQNSSEENGPLSIEEILKKSSYRTISTADQKLSIKCPVDWAELKEEELLKYFDPEKITQYQLKIPLAAIKKDGAQLIVTEIFMDLKSSFREALAANKEIYEKIGQEVNVLSQSESEKELSFEAEYIQKEEKMVSQEKIFEAGDSQEKKHFYIVSVVVPNDRLENYRQIAKEMMASIQFNN